MPNTNIATLKTILDRIPNANCKGLCQKSCGPLIVSRVENRYIREYCKEHNIKYKDFPTKVNLRKIIHHIKNPDSCRSCHYLTDDGRCSIYEVRPVICRMWGVTKTMPCPFECEPDRIMTTTEENEILDDMRYLR